MQKLIQNLTQGSVPLRFCLLNSFIFNVIVIFVAPIFVRIDERTVLYSLQGEKTSATIKIHIEGIKEAEP